MYLRAFKNMPKHQKLTFQPILAHLTHFFSFCLTLPDLISSLSWRAHYIWLMESYETWCELVRNFLTQLLVLFKAFFSIFLSDSSVLDCFNHIRKINYIVSVFFFAIFIKWTINLCFPKEFILIITFFVKMSPWYLDLKHRVTEGVNE